MNSVGLKRQLTKLSYQSLVKMLPKGFKFYRKPYKHQLIGLIFADQEKFEEEDVAGIGFYFAMGLGKSQTALDLTRLKKIKHGIIIVTITNVIDDDWIPEIKMHLPGYKVKILGRETPAERNAILERDEYDVYIIHYEALFLHARKKKGASNKVKDFILPALMNRKWEHLIVDESRLCMNVKAKRTRCVLQMAINSKRRTILTGMPISKVESEIFGQQFILDFGKTFGSSYRNFMNQYYKKEYNYAGYPEMKPRKGATREIKKLMYRHGLRIDRGEALDLPPTIIKKWDVFMTGDQLRFYKEMKEKHHGTIITKRNRFKIKAHMSKFLQVCGGWVKKDDKVIAFKDNAKMKELLYLLEGELANEKVVIFAHHKSEQTGIYDVLVKKKIPVIKLVSGMSPDDVSRGRKLFAESDKPIKAVCSLKKFSRGVNLIAAHYGIYYGLSFDFEAVKQSEMRFSRPGQKADRILLIRLICKDSVEDKKMLPTLNRNKRLVDALETGARVGDYV